MPEVFVSLGMGAAGFKADQIAEKALPGQDYALALGVKGDWLGAELGVSGGGFRFDPDASGNDLAIGGITADVRLQPKIDFVEPYVKAGVGAHRMYDGPIDEGASGTSLRLGAGVDFRGEHLGVGVEYLWSAYGFEGDSGAYGGHLGAQTGSIGAKILYHF
jgi:opacity protein-like surface antigen